MKLLVFVFSAVNAFSAYATETLPIGVWEGYRQMGSTYQEFFLEIESNGSGYYGFSPNIRDNNPICFAISKETLIDKSGYYQKDSQWNGLEFSLILVPSIDNTIEAINILKYSEKKSSLAQSFSLTPIDKAMRNIRTVEICKALLKKQK